MLKAKPAEMGAREALLAERNDRILTHMPLVRAIAVRLRERVPPHVEVDDLVHSGILGLIDAATKYDADKQVEFRHYAGYRIRGAMLDGLRQMDWAPREFRRRQKLVSEAVRLLAKSLQREPTEDEIAVRLGVPAEGRRELAVTIQAAGPVSSTPGNSDSPAAYEAIENPESRPDQLCAREEMRSVLIDAMRSLPERHQRVLTLYYAKEITMREIGLAMGINESRVSQIHKTALKKMGTVLRSHGIETFDAFEFRESVFEAKVHRSFDTARAA